ncbi:MAG TPA: heavy metal translocating P-type ATPase, partial [Gemmatimonadaceae bacterium]|nr:heavy metal translocating P-type ATPase [Gemmatimonadaceae bacterium]
TSPWAVWVWQAGLIVTAAPVVWRTARGIVHGRLAADVVATLAIIGAVLLVLPLPGLIVVIMQTGGEALERYAEGRASFAVRELEAAAPRIAHRIVDGETDDIPVADIAVGDELLVRPGEMLPCDVEVVSGRSHVDVSRITGEPIPISASPGTRLLSGSLNGESLLTVRALALASESQYARIVDLVRSAQASKSPLQRLADRYAVWFTPITLAVCLIAYIASGDPVRVLAVLVVATPCPLILATPVAILGGINRAARRQIVIRNGTALEQLGQVTTAVFDKTGTLTIGRPEVSRVVARDGLDDREVLRLAAGVEQGSSHQLARTVVDAARAAELEIPEPRWVREDPGRGVVGDVDGHTVAVGARSFVREEASRANGSAAALAHTVSGLRAFVAIDGDIQGAIEFADQTRAELSRSIAQLDRLGVRRTVIVSGDHADNVRAVAERAGVGDIYGDLLPQDKVAIVRDLMQQGETVMMVGDGTNDAPALSTAQVGVALAAHGGGIVAEAAGVVLLADDLSRVADAIRIGRRTMRIARESIWVGLGLSAIGMVLAAFGKLPPVAGAVLQEGIDLAVILNALRTSR